MQITGERIGLGPEDEERFIHVAAEQALRSGAPLRVGYEGDAHLAPSGIYNPKLVTEIKVPSSFGKAEIVPVIPRVKMLDFAAGNPMHWFTATGGSLHKAISSLVYYAHSRRLRADRLGDLLERIDIEADEPQDQDYPWHDFQPHHLDFLRDCAANLLDRAIVVELDAQT